MDRELETKSTSLKSLWNTFEDNTTWGTFTASSMLAGFDRFIGLNEKDADWVGVIADNFERAGGKGAISSLPDAAIEASLRAAGLFGPRGDVTFDDPVAYGMPPTTGYANDPVNTASGNFVEVENDLPLAGLVAGLTFKRTYNSRSDRVGPFGAGWASWASARLRSRPDGAEFEGPDGQRALFPRMGTGYGRVIGIQGLVEVSSTGLLIRWFDGTKWEFDDGGLPKRVDGGPGTGVTFRHDGERLVELSHESGKRISVEWTDERVSAVACTDGRRVEYVYDPTGSLVEVRREHGGRRYDVDDLGRIVRVRDADGVVEVENDYDDAGRVTAQKSPFGRRAVFHYLPGRVTVNQDEEADVSNTYIHDALGRLIGLVDGHGAKLTRSFDEWGNLVAVVERNGATTVREWDDRSRLKREVSPSGAWFSFVHDESDRLIEVTASSGAVTRYRYTADERTPSEIVDPEGGVTRLTVEGGLVHRIVDPDGVEVTFEFDADGNVVAAADARGNRAQIERDAAGRPLAATDPLGRRTRFEYDHEGRLVQRIDPGGALWRFEYTRAGRLTAVVDPEGGRQETRYGSHGEVEELEDELGRVTVRRYDDFGNLAGIVAPDGAKWELTYDALSRLTGVHDPAGSTWMREYDVNGNLVGTVDPVGTRYGATVDRAGRVTGLSDGVTSAVFDLDELGRATAHRRPDGTEMSATYDLCGRRTTVTDPSGGVTRYDYSPGGRVVGITAPSGRTTSFEYDACGRLAARIEPGGRRTVYSYGADGLLTRIDRPGRDHTDFAYDDAGRLVEEFSSGRGTTSYSYDVRGNVVSISVPGRGTRRFAYDATGRVVEAVDALGGSTRYEYNDRGWLTDTIDPLGGRTTRKYDEVGRIVAETDPLGRQTSFRYDAAGRMVHKVDGSGRETRWRYDASGRVVAFGAAGEREVRIERDDLGRPVQIQDGEATDVLGWDRAGRLVERRRGDVGLEWRYDSDGNREALVYADGTELAYEYDEAGDLKSLSHSIAGTMTFERDAAGRALALDARGLSARWEHGGGGVVGYELSANGVTRKTRIDRDESGRVRGTTSDGAETRFSYDAAGQLTEAVTPDGRLSFSYDANGRLVGESSPRGEVEYTYDDAGQLIQVGRDGDVTRFEYDGAGRRVREQGAGRARTYIWDRLGRLEAVRTQDGDVDRATRVVVDALGELAEVDGETLWWDTPRPDSPLLSIGSKSLVSNGPAWASVEDGQVDWLASDWTGNVGEFDPWGAPIEGEAGPRVGFLGELVVEGLVWLRHRVYDPSSRALLSRDPLPAVPGAPWAGNPYSYAANDPIGSADPLGLRPVTEAELAAYREQMGRSAFERAGDWVQDNWEFIAAGLVIAVGVGLVLTGVGGPIGAGILVGALSSGVMSAGIQQLTTGRIDLHQLARDIAIGGVAGGAGAGAGMAVSNSGRLATHPVLRGILKEGAENLVGGMAGRGLGGGNMLDPRGMAEDLVTVGGTRTVGGNLGSHLDEVVPGSPASAGQRVYRVWGQNPDTPDLVGQSGPWGHSWTRVDPRSVEKYRDLAGLPDEANMGRFVSEGILADPSGVKATRATPIGENVGGLDEVLIPDPSSQVELTGVEGVNPRF